MILNKIYKIFNIKRIKYGTIEKNNEVREIKVNVFNKCEVSDKKYSLSEIKYLPPVIPTKIIALGLDYFDYAEEFKIKIPEEPLIFIKPPSALIAHNEKIIYPKMSKRLDYEAELAIIIKNEIKNIEPKDAFKNILVYTCFNDVTARDLQSKDGQWARAKSFDTFTPILLLEWDSLKKEIR